MIYQILKNRRKKKNGLERSMIRWALMMLITIVISCLLGWIVLVLVTSIFNKYNSFNPIMSLMIIPVMGIFMGVEMFYITKGLYEQVILLIRGINQVSEGDFDTQINEEQDGLFCGVNLNEVFKNFNRMVKELKNNRIAQENFMNNFSHEFKTPISSIHGFAKLLQDTEVNDEEKLQYLRIIEEESARLAELSQKTLLLAKVENQQLVIERVYYSLDEQIKQCVILLSELWEEKRLHMNLILPETTCCKNKELLQQVWLNLISNAIKFTPQYGEITISITNNSRFIEVQITDTGIGISEEALEHIFDKYYQEDSSHAMKGYGMGLAITKRIIDLCDGSIQVTSSKGKGSSFKVNFPAF